jgi:hypothetical protein
VRRRRALRTGGAVLASMVLGSCGWTPADEQVLIRFFEHSRAYDTTRLAPLATVVFNPRTDGVVDRFEVIERGRDRSLEGGAVARDLTQRARVRSPGGREEERALQVTLERRGGSWVVTRVR